ncbi:MAG: hypothetical protein PHX93_00435 [Candidatus Peribacteraceae bacterium]|jgi:hypothetical protein|nr:hypothetical protein [Candidatus Peribacteraceae bacterium]
MSEFGGPEIGAPGEGGAGSTEALSEEAKQRFAAAAAGMQQIRREEKKSKRRDDQVAKAIVQFLDEADHAHLFVLISRLVARDCPSIFILAILSLIHQGCRETVKEYLSEILNEIPEPDLSASSALTKGGTIGMEEGQILIHWITRLQTVLSLDVAGILLKLMVDEKHIDGTILQLTTFVLQEFFHAQKKEVPFEKLQPLTASILQTVFEPFIPGVRKLLEERAKGTE